MRDKLFQIKQNEAITVVLHLTKNKSVQGGYVWGFQCFQLSYRTLHDDDDDEGDRGGKK